MNVPKTALLFFALVLWPAAAFAQTQGQTELNEQGFEAAAAGDFEGAIKLFDASIQLGELNVTYLNLGRAHQKANHCAPALEALTAAMSAPPAREPTHATVRSTAQKYLIELVAACPTKLRIRCTDDQMRVFVNDEPHACGDALTVKPGKFRIRGELDGQVYRKVVELEIASDERVLLGDEPETVDVPPNPEPLPAENAPWLGLVLSGLGAGSIGAGILLDTIPESARDGEFQALDVAPVVLYSLGTAALVWGIIELL